MRTDEELVEICNHVRSGALSEGPIVITVEEFRRLYEIFLVHNNRQVPNVVVVNLGDQAHLILPEWSRQEIVIEGRKPIDKVDFAFLSMVDWRGADRPTPSFLKFLMQEIWHSKLRTGIILSVAFATLLGIGPPAKTFDLINSLLIEASTVFLSIYLIFTVSQSERLSYDDKLFDRGILHKYYSDDRNVTEFAILTIAMVFANTVLINVPDLTATLQNPLPFALGRWVAAISTSLVITMLFHTFFIVANYYLERTRDVAERQHVGRIFHKEYCRRHPSDCE